MVPFTCRVPQQIESDRKKLEERREASFTYFLHGNANDKQPTNVDHLNWKELLHCSTLVLNSYSFFNLDFVKRVDISKPIGQGSKF